MNYHLPKWCGSLAVFAYHAVAIYLLLAHGMDVSQRVFGMLLALLTVGGRTFAPLVKAFLKSYVNKKY